MDVFPVADLRNCSLHDDEDCYNSPNKVENFIRFCSSYPTSNSFPSTSVNYYFLLKYYVDTDTDINLDRYEGDLEAQVSAIVDIVGQPLFLVLGNVEIWHCDDRTINTGVIKYTVFY